MKKNIAMRVAAFLFILTMISTCAFATTFAKYVTSDSANDSARVAKWGVVVDVTAEDALFVANDDNTVISADQKATVVAPGTDGQKFIITITGQPEVKANVNIAFTLDLVNWYIPAGENAQEFYCPIVFNVSVKEGNAAAVVTEIKGSTYTELSELVNDIEELVDHNVDYAPNVLLDRTIEISWSWAFGTDADVETNKKDTALGMLDAAPTISFSATCTVTQLD